MNTPSTSPTSTSAASTPGADASAGLRALPGDVLERILQRLVDPRDVGNAARQTPRAARVVLGPGSLGADGDAYRVVAQPLGLARLRRWPTWFALVEGLRHECARTPAAPSPLPLLDHVESNLPLRLRIRLGAGRALDTHCKVVTKLLAAAVCRSQVAVAEVLLAEGADVHALHKGCSLLSLAVGSRGRVAMVETLLAAGARIHSEADDDDGPLVLRAVQNMSDLIVAALLAAGADVNGTQRGNDFTALLWAATAGGTNIVRLLLAGGANVNARGAGGRTALIGASYMGHGDIVQQLLAAGADLRWTTTDDFGVAGESTALSLARGRVHTAVIAMLEAAEREREQAQSEAPPPP